MREEGLSVVCFIHNIYNRGIYRLNNFLYSLRKQDGDLYPDIIVVDVSNDDSFKDVNDVCKKYGACHIYKELEGRMWNKPLALNAGIKACKTDYVLCTDVDSIFQTNFLSTVWKAKTEKCMISCRVYLTQNNQVLKKFKMSYFDDLLSKSDFLEDKRACGCCQFAKTDWFYEVGGYDESFNMWSGMDYDILMRADAYGLEIKWVDDKTSILHQWHKVEKQKYNRLFFRHYKKNNRKIRIQEQRRDKADVSYIYKNIGWNWGALYEEQEDKYISDR